MSLPDSRIPPRMLPWRRRWSLVGAASLPASRVGAILCSSSLSTITGKHAGLLSLCSPWLRNCISGGPFIFISFFFLSPSRDLFFNFFFFFSPLDEQIYTTGVFCCCSGLSVVKSVSQKWECFNTLSLSLSPCMRVRKEDKRKDLHWLAVDQPQGICCRAIGFADMINGLEGLTAPPPPLGNLVRRSL